MLHDCLPTLRIHVRAGSVYNHVSSPDPSNTLLSATLFPPNDRAHTSRSFLTLSRLSHDQLIHPFLLVVIVTAKNPSFLFFLLPKHYQIFESISIHRYHIYNTGKVSLFFSLSISFVERYLGSIHTIDSLTVHSQSVGELFYCLDFRLYVSIL